eukprot:4828887-Pleurochrysis_carterae.AAC.2
MRLRRSLSRLQFEAVASKLLASLQGELEARRLGRRDHPSRLAPIVAARCAAFAGLHLPTDPLQAGATLGFLQCVQALFTHRGLRPLLCEALGDALLAQELRACNGGGIAGSLAGGVAGGSAYTTLAAEHTAGMVERLQARGAVCVLVVCVGVFCLARGRAPA